MVPLTKQNPTTQNLFELKLKIWYVKKINEDQIVYENHETPLRGRLEIKFSKKNIACPTIWHLKCSSMAKLCHLVTKKGPMKGQKKFKVHNLIN